MKRFRRGRKNRTTGWVVRARGASRETFCVGNGLRNGWKCRRKDPKGERLPGESVPITLLRVVFDSPSGHAVRAGGNRRTVVRGRESVAVAIHGPTCGLRTPRRTVFKSAGVRLNTGAPRKRSSRMPRRRDDRTACSGVFIYFFFSFSASDSKRFADENVHGSPVTRTYPLTRRRRLRDRPVTVVALRTRHFFFFLSFSTVISRARPANADRCPRSNRNGAL